MINTHVDGIFIHVSNIQRAIDWYSRLLDLPKQDTAHDGMIYNLPVVGSTQVILDAYPKPVPPRDTGPRVMFTTPDLAAARELATSLSDEVTEVEDIGSSLIFFLDDPDGNRICIRQPKVV